MRTESRFGILVLALLLVLVPRMGAMADPVPQPENGDQGAATPKESQPSGATRQEKPAAGGVEEPPAEPFIPSESISADSAVSFPVDI